MTRPGGRAELVGFEAGPHKCDECRCTFQQSPWAFPLMDLRHEERLRFCSQACLDVYDSRTARPSSIRSQKGNQE